jgi:hypothetical protein
MVTVQKRFIEVDLWLFIELAGIVYFSYAASKDGFTDNNTAGLAVFIVALIADLVIRRKMIHNPKMTY